MISLLILITDFNDLQFINHTIHDPKLKTTNFMPKEDSGKCLLLFKWQSRCIESSSRNDLSGTSL